MNKPSSLLGLGADWSTIAQIGAGLFDTAADYSASNKANKTAQQQTAAELQAAQLAVASQQKIVKGAIIAVSILVAGGIVITLIKSGRNTQGQKKNKASK